MPSVRGCTRACVGTRDNRASIDGIVAAVVCAVSCMAPWLEQVVMVDYWLVAFVSIRARVVWLRIARFSVS